MTKVVLRNPFPVIDRDEFLTPFDRMFDQIVGTSFPELNKQVGVNPFQGTAYPKVNVYEYDDKVGVVAEIPGLDKKDLTVEVDDGVLTISGDKKTEVDDPDVKYVYKELKRSSFKRSFKVDDATLNVSKISAKFDNGILNVTIPKKEVIETKAKKVKIL